MNPSRISQKQKCSKKGENEGAMVKDNNQLEWLHNHLRNDHLMPLGDDLDQISWGEKNLS